jgi:hypothetical protein
MRRPRGAGLGQVFSLASAKEFVAQGIVIDEIFIADASPNTRCPTSVATECSLTPAGDGR